MKIAALASGTGEKALYLHNFFKEGNRVTVDCLLTDRKDSPALAAMEAEGVSTFYFAPEEWNADSGKIADFLRHREVEMIVVDDFDTPLTGDFADSWPDAIVPLTDAEQGPGEVAAAITRLNNIRDGKLRAASAYSSKENPSPEEEWAESLGIDYEPAAQTPPPLPPGAASPFAMPPQTPPAPAAPAMSDTAKPVEPMPDSYLIWSVLATVLCCLIPGIIAIIYSASVSTRYYAGDLNGARRASDRAQIWVIVSIVTGIVWSALYLPLMLLTGQ